MTLWPDNSTDISKHDLALGESLFERFSAMASVAWLVEYCPMYPEVAIGYLGGAHYRGWGCRLDLVRDM